MTAATTPSASGGPASDNSWSPGLPLPQGVVNFDDRVWSVFRDRQHPSRGTSRSARLRATSAPIWRCSRTRTVMHTRRRSTPGRSCGWPARRARRSRDTQPSATPAAATSDSNSRTTSPRPPASPNGILWVPEPARGAAACGGDPLGHNAWIYNQALNGRSLEPAYSQNHSFDVFFVAQDLEQAHAQGRGGRQWAHPIAREAVFGGRPALLIN